VNSLLGNHSPRRIRRNVDIAVYEADIEMAGVNIFSLSHSSRKFTKRQIFSINIALWVRTVPISLSPHE
jgi:hypothetical protein